MIKLSNKDYKQAQEMWSMHISAQRQLMLLNLLENIVRQKIFNGAKAANTYSVLVDKSKDISKKNSSMLP